MLFFFSFKIEDYTFWYWNVRILSKYKIFVAKYDINAQINRSKQLAVNTNYIQRPLELKYCIWTRNNTSLLTAAGNWQMLSVLTPVVFVHRLYMYIIYQKNWINGMIFNFLEAVIIFLINNYCGLIYLILAHSQRFENALKNQWSSGQTNYMYKLIQNKLIVTSRKWTFIFFWND